MTDARPPESRVPVSRRLWFYLALGLLLIVAVGTRLFRLQEWGLAGDELYTLRDSLDPELHPLQQPIRFLTAHPLLFLLNQYLLAPFVELDEFTLRLFPVAFGILGVVTLVLVGQRLVGARAALVAGVLVVFNPWHLVHSQFARYYSLVFLMAAISPAALYLGVKDRSRGWIAVGVGCAILAWLAHPTGILPTVGFLAWLALYALRRMSGRSRRLVLTAVGVAVVVGFVLAGMLLSRWAALGQEWGIGGLWLVVSWANRLGPGPAVAAVGGGLLLWLDGRWELALFLAAAVVVPLAVLGVVGNYVSVHTAYLFATAPYAFLAAGVFADRVMAAFDRTRERAVAGAGVVLVVLATTAPSFVSHYLDGGRPDFRGAARYVERRAEPGDRVLTDLPMGFHHYSPGLEARILERRPARLDSVYRSIRSGPSPGAVWVVPYVRSQGGFGVQGLEEAEPWVRRHCELSVRFGAVRIDHERNFVPVWRCPGE